MEERTKSAGLNAFRRILECWGLQEGDAPKLLGLDQMPAGSDLTVDQSERISHTLAIYRALHTLLQDPNADEWIQKPNHAPLFNARAALDLMMEGTEGFRKVRIYLEGQVEGSWDLPGGNSSITEAPIMQSEPTWQRHIRERSFPLDSYESDQSVNIIRSDKKLKVGKIRMPKKQNE